MKKFPVRNITYEFCSVGWSWRNDSNLTYTHNTDFERADSQTIVDSSDLVSNLFI